MNEPSQYAPSNGSNVSRLMDKGVPLLPQRAWCVLPGDKPNLDGRTIPLRGSRARIEDVICDIDGINAAGLETVVWMPPDAGSVVRASGGVYADLRWGYTVHVLGRSLVSLQRVVFLADKARTLVAAAGTHLLRVPIYHASSWSGMRPSRSPHVN